MSDQQNQSQQPRMASTELLPALEKPSFWPDDSEEVELIETHISWVFLTRRFAFKLKKPVAFDFLDFRSPTARRTACEDEVRLNRRLAPDVYLGVVPITQASAGELKLAGEGEVVDYLVQMRRLSAADRLDSRMAKDQLQPADLEPLIHKLTQFYQQAQALSLQPADYLNAVESHVRENRQALLRTDVANSLGMRVCAAQLRLLKFHPKLLRNRAAAGHLIEGHGDLRPEHIYLAAEPVIVDCIEFNADFRQLDIADELCFLAMECDVLGHGNWGEQVLSQCLANLRDQPSLQLLAFYKSYRATVRAKVAALRAEQLTGQERESARQTAVKDLQLAERYLGENSQPTLFVVAGLMGAGKSTLASALSEALGLEHLQTDKIRAECLGAEDALDKFGEGKYSPARREQVYAALLEQAKQRLADGLSVVLDGSFSKLTWREKTVTLAKQCNAQQTLIWCHCPVEIAKERIAARRVADKDASQARPELLTEQLATAEFPLAEEAAFQVDTTLPREEQLPRLLGQLGSA